MEKVQTDEAGLKALQDAIYRDKVERARRMTPEEKLDAVFSLSGSVIERMKEGVRWQLEIEEEKAVSEALALRIEKLREVRDREIVAL